MVVGASMTSTQTRSLDRATVIAYAGDLLDEVGVHELRMSDVAGRAGVTQPALYRHVDNIADLWREIGLATRAELAEALTAASLGRAGNDAVIGVARAWRDYARAHPGRYRSTEKCAVAGDAQLEAAVGNVLSVLASALRGFDLDDDTTARGALMIRSVLHGFVSFELGDGNVDSLNADQTFDDLVDMLCTGLDAL